MASHFKAAKINAIHLEPEEISRVLKVEPELEYAVQEYRFNKIEKGFEGDYRRVKSQYGALAAGDAEKIARTKKDERFRLNLASRSQLKIEDEERRIIEERVQEYLDLERDKAYTESYQKGLEEGRAAGRDESLNEFRSQSEARLKQLDSMIGSIESHRNHLLETQERYLLELIAKIARRVILRDLSGDTKYLERLVHTVVEKVGSKDNIRILISESDALTIQEIRENLQRAEPELKNLKVEVSPEVVGGGCFVESQWTFVDASVERQIEGILKALVGDSPEGGPLSAPSGGETA